MKLESNLFQPDSSPREGQVGGLIRLWLGYTLQIAQLARWPALAGSLGSTLPRFDFLQRRAGRVLCEVLEVRRALRCAAQLAKAAAGEGT